MQPFLFATPVHQERVLIPSRFGGFDFFQVVCEWHAIEARLDRPIWACRTAASFPLGHQTLVDCGNSVSM